MTDVNGNHKTISYIGLVTYATLSVLFMANSWPLLAKLPFVAFGLYSVWSFALFALGRITSEDMEWWLRVSR